MKGDPIISPISGYQRYALKRLAPPRCPACRRTLPMADMTCACQSRLQPLVAGHLASLGPGVEGPAAVLSWRDQRRAERLQRVLGERIGREAHGGAEPAGYSPATGLTVRRISLTWVHGHPSPQETATEPTCPSCLASHGCDLAPGHQDDHACDCGHTWPRDHPDAFDVWPGEAS